MDFRTASVVDLAAQVRSGQVSASELVDHALGQVAAHNGTVNAFVAVDEERARAGAATVDALVAAGEDPGPLAGIPLGVKDLEDADRVVAMSLKSHRPKLVAFLKAQAPGRKDKLLKKIEGVESVDNQIEVLPLSPNDDRIRRATYRAIYSKAPLERYQLSAVPPIHIIVNHGNVTLEGVVATEGDKNMAEIAAKGVPGAFSVKNNLRTEK